MNRTTAKLPPRGKSPANGGKRATAERVLLLTRDAALEQRLAMAAAASGRRLIVARNAVVAAEIIRHRGGEVGLVVIDFDKNTRGMSLVRAVNTWRCGLSIVAITSANGDHFAMLASAHGVRGCLPKPIRAAGVKMRSGGRQQSKCRANVAASHRKIEPRFGPLVRAGDKREEMASRRKHRSASSKKGRP